MAQADIESWTGRTQTETDVAAPFPARALAATLDADSGAEPGDALPPLRHWLYFLPLAPMREVGPDGHPKRGGFLPPVDLPRRMWAGGRLAFRGAIRAGDRIERRSEIASVRRKSGAAGEMVFVTVRHLVSAEGRAAVEEEQDLVFLPMPERFAPPAPTPLPDALDWSEPRPVDPVLLFRFSALTFNGHRIHYDRPYAEEAEKYPGLVVHGPLQAILLMDAALARAPGRTPARFAFRAIRPLFAHDAIGVHGKGPELFTANGDGAIGMRAEIEWAGE